MDARNELNKTPMHLASQNGHVAYVCKTHTFYTLPHPHSHTLTSSPSLTLHRTCGTHYKQIPYTLTPSPSHILTSSHLHPHILTSSPSHPHIVTLISSHHLPHILTSSPSHPHIFTFTLTSSLSHSTLSHSFHNIHVAYVCKH